MLVLALKSSGATHRRQRISGGHSGGVTPVPIPNTEVKTACADGTWGKTPWESRSPPELISIRSPLAGASVVFGRSIARMPDQRPRRPSTRGAGSHGGAAPRSPRRVDKPSTTTSNGSRSSSEASPKRRSSTSSADQSRRKAPRQKPDRSDSRRSATGRASSRQRRTDARDGLAEGRGRSDRSSTRSDQRHSTTRGRTAGRSDRHADIPVEAPQTEAARRRAIINAARPTRQVGATEATEVEPPRVSHWRDDGPVGSVAARPTRDVAHSTRGRDDPSALALATAEDRAGVATRLDVGERRAGRTLRAIARGLDAFEAERWRDAVATLTPVSKDVPSSAFVQEILGLSLYRLQRWVLAAQHLESARQLSKTVENHAVLADCYRALRRWNLVDDLWSELRAAAPDPDTVAEGRIVTASALADRGNLPGAIALLEKSSRSPKRVFERHLRTWYVLGDFHDRSGNVLAARQCFQRVAAHDRRFSDVADRLSQLGG